MIDAGRRRVVLADGLGRYHLRGVAPGLVRIRALQAGHEVGQVEVLVPSGSSVAVDLELIRQPIEMPEFTVLAAGVTVPEVSPRDLRVAAPAWAASEVALRTLAEGTGMAEAGVLRARGGEGGGGDPSEPRDVLLMRGSTTDLKLVLLDGAPVYTPFHLGGLLPSFDATTMGGAVLHVGGAPARYDGGLSYILDLRTRRPRRDRLHGGGALDLMSGQASIEGPLGERAGLLLAGRALHAAAALVWGGAGSPYGYADALLRFDAEPAAGHRLGVTAFANHESVFLDLASTLGLPCPDAARAVGERGRFGRLPGRRRRYRAGRDRGRQPLPGRAAHPSHSGRRRRRLRESDRRPRRDGAVAGCRRRDPSAVRRRPPSRRYGGSPGRVVRCAPARGQRILRDRPRHGGGGSGRLCGLDGTGQRIPRGANRAPR